MRETIKSKIFKHLDEYGHILDKDLAKIYNGEPNFCGAEEVKRRWRRLQFDRKSFDDAVIVKTHRAKRNYLISLDGVHWYKVGKDYFDEIEKKIKC